MREILSIGWWIYVLIMMVPTLFIWEGLDNLMLKMLTILIMLVIPMIFWND